MKHAMRDRQRPANSTKQTGELASWRASWGTQRRARSSVSQQPVRASLGLRTRAWQKRHTLPKRHVIERRRSPAEPAWFNIQDHWVGGNRIGFKIGPTADSVCIRGLCANWRRITAPSTFPRLTKCQVFGSLKANLSPNVARDAFIVVKPDEYKRRGDRSHEY